MTADERQKAGMPDKTPDLSVVIPVLNEAQALPLLLEDLAQQRGLQLQVIVADGGSGDSSQTIARQLGAELAVSEPGRARQMNHGASLARAKLVLFLHADSRLPKARLLADAEAAFINRGDGRAAGHFALKFNRSTSQHGFQFRYMVGKSALNRRYSCNGDQGLLLSRARFFETGGFDTRLHFLEDQRMVERLRQDGEIFTLPGYLETSARRFETEGAAARYHLMAIIMAMYVCEIDEFFEQAPQVYRQQAELDTLLLTPYFRLLRRLMCRFGWRRSLGHWRVVGDFVLKESWQPFFMLDVIREHRGGVNDRRWLNFHDRAVAPVIHNRVASWLMTLLVFLVSMGPIAAWYRWRERKLLD